ncbi:MAG: IS256 family transposase, partial [Gemmatimonadaceae bacterium]|nr:IS256 family transposase [Gemmatimonadaceae bacterium]
MARRKRAAAEPLPAGLTPEVLDQLVAGVQTAADFQLVWRQLQKAMAERVLKAELTHHLGYPAGGERGPDGNA